MCDRLPSLSDVALCDADQERVYAAWMEHPELKLLKAKLEKEGPPTKEQLLELDRSIYDRVMGVRM